MSISVKSKFTKCVAALLLVVLLGIVLLQPAAAVFGKYTNFTSGSRSYKARSEAAISFYISQNKDYAIAVTYLETSTGANVPASTMGVQGTLYRYNGSNSYTLESSFTLKFNGSATNVQSYCCEVPAVKGRSYVAEGYVEAKND